MSIFKIAYIGCDAWGCDEDFTLGTPYVPALRTAAREHGWFVGLGNGARQFCPEHLPSGGAL